MLKKIWKLISSMRFALILLVILAAACAVGSFLTQGQSYAWYASVYSEHSAALIKAFYLDDVYHSWWFLLLAAFLCCNLLFCNLLRLPQLIRRTRDAADPKRVFSGSAAISEQAVRNPRALFAALHMPKPKELVHDDKPAMFAVSNRAGIWGAWICHLGILLLILGFGIGQITHQEYTVYGVAGQSKQVGDTGYILSIDDFRVDLREDDTVEQYTARITVRSTDGGSRSEEISVNHPAALFGYKFYQNSTGWAARVQITKSGDPLQDEILCAGDYLTVKDMPQLAVYFNAFYPDYVLIEGRGPATASGVLRNPAYLYTVYYQDEVVGMNALREGETIKIDDYEVRFSEPQNYTVIQIKQDRFTWLALLGGLTTTLGLFLAFYLQQTAVWAIREEDDDWTVYGQCGKGGVLFRERFHEAAERIKKSQ